MTVRPPGPRNPPVLGHLTAFRRDAPRFLERIAREFGDISYFRLGKQDVTFVNHPDWVRDVLVTRQHHFVKSRLLQRAKALLGEGLLTSEAPLHTRQRRLAQPAFHRDRLAGYAETMINAAVCARERMVAGETRDMAFEMMRLTLAIVGRTLFSADVESESKEIGAALTDVLQLFEIVLTPFSEWIEKLPLPAVRRFHAARKRLDETIYRMISERRQSGEDCGDLLSMLLLARDEDGSGGMTDDQVRDEALTLFLAGHETTANALTWTWYLLSQHPEVEQRFHEELADVLQGRTPVPDDFARLPYTTTVFQEALRLYPPAWGIGRMVAKPVEIGGYALDRGDIVLMSPYVMHRDSRYYAEPDRFLPERWTSERKTALPKFAFFPFGGGARVCIGENFAWMEGVLLLATIGQSRRFRLAPGQRVDHRALITLRPREGMRMTVGA